MNDINTVFGYDFQMCLSARREQSKVFVSFEVADLWRQRWGLQAVAVWGGQSGTAKHFMKYELKQVGDASVSKFASEDCIRVGARHSSFSLVTYKRVLSFHCTANKIFKALFCCACEGRLSSWQNSQMIQTHQPQCGPCRLLMLWSCFLFAEAFSQYLVLSSVLHFANMWLCMNDALLQQFPAALLQQVGG